MRLKLLLLLCLSLAASARAQSGFHAYPGTETLIEGGTVGKLTVVSSDLQFIIRPPKNWSCQVDETGRKIFFIDPSGRSAVTVQFTANSPGTLPAEDVLRAQVLRAHPGAAIVQYAVCSTNYRPGVFFDLVRVAAPGLVQRMRHAFVALPAGQVEFVLTASDDEFGLGKPAITDMLSTFRVTPLIPK
jgi:hypothetical protein